MLMYMCKLYVKCRSHEFFNCLDCEFLNQKNFSEVKSSPCGKIAPMKMTIVQYIPNKILYIELKVNLLFSSTKTNAHIYSLYSYIGLVTYT